MIYSGPIRGRHWNGWYTKQKLLYWVIRTKISRSEWAIKSICGFQSHTFSDRQLTALTEEEREQVCVTGAVSTTAMAVRLTGLRATLRTLGHGREISCRPPRCFCSASNTVPMAEELGNLFGSESKNKVLCRISDYYGCYGGKRTKVSLSTTHALKCRLRLSIGGNLVWTKTV